MTAQELVPKVQRLAPASQTVIKLIGLLNKPAHNNEEIVQVLKYDNVLTAKLLRACNSPFYGFSEAVSSLEQAVLIIGYEEIQRLVFAFAFSDTMTRSLPGYEAEANELWRHSVLTALICEFLAKDDDAPLDSPPGICFTAGLLHDIGKLALAEVLAKNHQAAIRSLIMDRNLSSVEAEQQVLETNHAEVGAVLLQKWNLPKPIVEAVGNHHHPESRPKPQLSALVNAGNALARLVGSPFDWEAFTARAAEGVPAALKFTPEKLHTFSTHLADLQDRADHLGKQG